MNIVFFTHPQFLVSQSMPRYTQWLANGIEERGHSIEIWAPKAYFYKLPVPKSLKKWMGYIDQYLLFPSSVKNKLSKCSSDTLFVFTDHALGPWVPLVANRKHIIHCHDFLAQRSALGEIAENKTSWTGQKYQDFIRRGFSQGKNYISISKNTRADLHRLLGTNPQLSEVVYNGLNRSFSPAADKTKIREELQLETGINLEAGYILHVGGNQWYKNRKGVIEIYDSWRSISDKKHPLLMVGAIPSASLLEQYEKSPFKKDIHLLSLKPDDFVKKVYAGAYVFLFPSLAEGFGWPIAEAMASGCPVITTNLAPMTEVGGDAAVYIDQRPVKSNDALDWAIRSAQILEETIQISPSAYTEMMIAGLENVKRFEPNFALDQIQEVYESVVTPALAKN